MSTSSDPSSAEPPFARVAVLGLGLMGGSLARALAELEPAPVVRGWTASSSDLEAATRSGVLDGVSTSLATCVADAELVVLALPLRASIEGLASVAASAPAEATVTDVVSLKGPLAAAAVSAGLSQRWVGGHPMAGGEGSGFGASRSDLYRGATVWMTPGQAARERTDAVAALWRAIGAEPAVIDVDDHDRLMTLVSHLPQIASNALASVLEEASVDPALLGPGGRDMTRLAASDAGMWKDLFEASGGELAGALRALGRESARLAELLERGDVDAVAELMRRTARWRAEA